MAYILFGVRFMAHCIIAYIYGHSVLTGKISFLLFAHCVYHAMFAFHIYPVVIFESLVIFYTDFHQFQVRVILVFGKNCLKIGCKA